MMDNCTVKIPDQGYEHGQEMIKWAQDYCPSLITTSAVIEFDEDIARLTGSNYVRIFYFGQASEATLFSLKWS